MNNENSTIRSRQELKKLFKAGTITAEEYEAYKKRLIYGIAIPVKPRPSKPTPAGSQTSFSSGKAIETKIIYPSKQKETKPLTSALPFTEKEYNEDQSLIGVNPKRRKKFLLISLTVLGVLTLLNVLVFLYLHNPTPVPLSHKSNPEVEKTTSANLPQKNLPASTIKTASESPERTPLAITKKNIVARPSAKPENKTNNTASATNGTGIITNENEIFNKALQKLNAYYTDMQAAPFNASNYFAPQVERYYTLSNTTPVAITKNINSYHFSEFLEGQSNIQEGSMKLVDAGNKGYELTYLEHGSAFRKSKKQKQEVKARVRVRFNPDFKITYFRQEQLLQNRFIKE